VAVGSVPLAYLLAHVVFRVAVSYAIAYAPNGGGISSNRVPLGLPPEGATELRVSVGPPAATLGAWVLPPKASKFRGTIVLLHGVRLDRRSLLGFGRRFSDAGYRAVLVDLRGHGESSGVHLTYGQVEAHDVSQLLDAVEARYGRSPTGVFGYSYGGAVAVHVAEDDHRVSAVVAASSFASMRRVVVDYEHHYLPSLSPWIPGSWVDAAVEDAGRLGDFDPDRSPERAAAHAQASLLFIHGGADTQVPPEHAEILERAAGSRAEISILPGETHQSILEDGSGRVQTRALDFFSRHLTLR
jgi:uncharacterized protein